MNWGKGTTISVLLPIVGEVDDVTMATRTNDEIITMEMMSISGQSRSETNHEEADGLAHDSADKPTVLVVEDNEDMRQYIVGSVIDNYRVVTAPNGQAGVEKAIEEVPDIIISDVMMPIMDGYQLTETLKQNDISCHIPIILLTARGDRESRLKGWHQKADEYLTKPFDVEELNIRLNNLLDIRDILKRRFAETLFDDQQPADAALPSETTQAQSEDPRLKLQRQFVERLNEVLEKLYQEPTTTVENIAAGFALSERQFSRKFKSTLEMTPNEYVRRFRLEKAKELLAAGESAGTTSFEVGFSSQSYFGKCFKAQFGLSPGDYREQCLGSSD